MIESMGAMTDISGSNGMPHPFSLDDLDDQSRSIATAQMTFPKSIPKVVAVESSAAQWFSNIMLKRKRNGVLVYTLISSILFLVGLGCLQLSLIHPIRSIMNTIAVLISPSTYLLLSLYVSLDAAFMLATGILLLKFDVEKRLSVWNYIPWIVFLTFLLIDIAKKCILLSAGIGIKHDLSNRIYLSTLGVISAVSCFWITFRFNYQLVFPSVELTPAAHIQTAIHSERDKVIKVMFKIIKWALVVSFILGLPFFGWSLFSVLLDFRLYFIWFLLSFLHLYSHYLGVSILKGFVLQRYTFQLPTPYPVIRSNSQEAPDLIVALESSSTMLKAFALWDLRDLAIKNLSRRAAIYSLSHPGGHPRNWNAVKDVCMRIIDSVKNQVEHETRQIQQETYATLQLSADDRSRTNIKGGPTILMANQLYKDKNLRRRILNSDSRDRFPESCSMVDSWVRMLNKWSNTTNTSHFIFSSYEGNLAVLCIESLGMLIWHSYEEDSYGVVQKDLRSIMSLLLQLIVGLDRYIRHNKQTTNEGILSNLGLINALDSTVGSTINRISSRFGSALNSIGLTSLELDILEMVTGSSRTCGTNELSI